MVKKRKRQKSKFEYHFCFELKREILRLYDEAQPISQTQVGKWPDKPIRKNKLKAQVAG